MSARDDDAILARELGRVGGSAGRLVGARTGGYVGGWLGARLIGNDTYEIALLLRLPFGPAVGHCDATLRRLGTPRDDGETTENRTIMRALLGSGFLNLNPALVTIIVSHRDETTTEVTIRGVAKEGLIKQRAGQKAAERVAAAL